MKPPETCPRENEAVLASRSDQLDESLAAHVENCPHCREAVRIAAWMQNLAAETPRQRPLPDAELLWIKSQLFGRQEAADRVWQPLWVGETLARAVVGAFAAAWLALSWPTIQGYLVGSLTSPTAASSLSYSTGNPWPITAASVAVALGLLAFVRYLYPLLTRD